MKRIDFLRLAEAFLVSIVSPISLKAEPAVAEGKTKVLVVYFSVTGNTEKAAQKIAAGAGADLHRIQPAKKYTSADWDSQNQSSRSSVVQNDPKARPAIMDDLKKRGCLRIHLLGLPYLVESGAEDHQYLCGKV